MPQRPFKTERNLAQYAAKKVVGKAHTHAFKSDLAELFPSGIQMSSFTIFGEEVPSSPVNEPPDVMFANADNVQLVTLYPVEIDGTIYDADQSSEYGGDDSPQIQGPHAWYLKLPDNYETVSAGQFPEVGSSVFVNDQALYSTLGKLQVVPPSMYLNSSNPGSNPYAPKIYTWNGENEATVSNNPLFPSDALDWFFDSYNGIIFFQEYENNPKRVPYKVECYIYTGKFSKDTGGGGGGGGSGETIAGVQNYNNIFTDTLDAEVPHVIDGFDFEFTPFSHESLNVYLNGQYLLYGETADFDAGDCDFTMQFNANITEIKFNVGLEIGDVLSISYLGGVNLATKSVVLWEPDASMDSARVLTAGDGITITAPNPTTLLVNNTGLLQRTKLHKEAQQGYLAGTASEIFTIDNFPVDLNFETVGFSDSRIDIFLDGVMLLKDVHYELKDQESTLTSSQFKLKGSTVIQQSNIVTVVLF